MILRQSLFKNICFFILLMSPIPSFASTLISDFVENLLSQMTVEEKLGQLQMLDGLMDGSNRPEHLELAKKGLLGSVLMTRGSKNVLPLQEVAVHESRLGIPILFTFDVIHGYRTVFPVPLASASSWNLDLVERSSEVAAREASAAGIKLSFAPMADITLDPRWGRIVESGGEDPYLVSELIRSIIRGFQGNDPSDPKRVGATAKHWVAYGAAEAGRDYNTTDVSIHRLRDLYFKPFKAAVEENVTAIMPAFSVLNGIPSTVSPYTEIILKNEWGFDGTIISDYTAVEELYLHRLVDDLKDAAYLSLKAGVDIEMVSRNFNRFNPELIKSGRLSEEYLNSAVRRVLRLKEKLGLFDNPFVDPLREKKELFTKENKTLALELARQSIVLLKNDKKILPLDVTKLKQIALIGPFVNDQVVHLGSWAGDGRPKDTQTIYKEFRRRLFSQVQIEIESGVSVLGGNNNESSDLEGIEKAVNLAKKSELVIMTLGEPAHYSGEAASRTNLGLPGRQQELLEAIYKTGKPIVVLLMNGRPVVIPWMAQNIPTIVETWYLGTMGAQAIVDVLFGVVNPSGRLSTTFPRNVGQIPIYYRHLNTGRPASDEDPFYKSMYLDSPNSPQFPFGYGLSYSEFKLDNLSITKMNIPYKNQNAIKVQVNLTNLGPYDGYQVVQFYTQDLAASCVRPVKELKMFKKVFLPKEHSQLIEFTLDQTTLSFPDFDGLTIFEPGNFNVFVGFNSQETLKGSFQL